MTGPAGDPGAETGGPVGGAGTAWDAGGVDARDGGRQRVRRRLARVRKMARAWLERARAEAEDLRRQAWQEGYEAGLAAARAEMAEEARRQAEAWERRRQELEERFRRLVEDSRDQVLELALAVARRVAGDNLAADRERLRARIDEALARLAGEGARVLVHPDSAAELAAGRPWPPGVELVGDTSLAPGDFQVDSPRGSVDGRVDAQVERLARALRDEAAPGEEVAAP